MTKCEVFRIKIIGVSEAVQNVKFRDFKTAENHFNGKDYEWIHYKLHICLQIFEPKYEKMQAWNSVTF